MRNYELGKDDWETIEEHSFLSNYSSPTPPLDWNRIQRAEEIHFYAMMHGISFDQAEKVFDPKSE